MSVSPNLTTLVRLYFRASDLRDADITSKSDPYCVLSSVIGGEAFQTQYTANGSQIGGRVASATASSVVFGQTEVVKNCLSPEWKGYIDVPFNFEARQVFRVNIMDDDGRGFRGDDSLGQVDFVLSSVVCAPNMTKSFPLQPRGSVTISAVEQSANTRDKVVVRFRGRCLKQMDTFSESDCFFSLRRLLPGGQTRELYKSEVVDNNNNPIWRDIHLGMGDLTGNNPTEQTLEFNCWDEDVTSHESMGRFRFSFAELSNNFSSKTPFKLIGTENHSRPECFGDIFVDVLIVHHRPTFAEFLQIGTQISLDVSIDFTGSNGDPRTPQSLHYMDPARPNQYLQAIMSVGDILVQYDTDKQIPVFGFGAGFNGVPNHFFNVNLQPSPFVNGVQGVIDAYAKFLPTCTLWGPTNFAPTIQGASKSAFDKHRDFTAGRPLVYTVLLIITDGAITDMDQTIEAIVAADALPLSIVIVGVGNADFSAMDFLDGDRNALRSGSRVSRRDFVQFVPYRDFINYPREALAAAVLKEIPAQFERYAEINGIQALPPRARELK